jgi:hypothetical protein
MPPTNQIPQLFDLVMGNPPYVSFYSKQSQGGANTQKELDYLVKSQDFIKDKQKLGRYNTVMFFISQALKLLKPNGYVGFIVDTNIHSNPYLDLRQWLVENFTIIQIVDKINAFEEVASSQVILIIKKAKPKVNHKIIYKQPSLIDATKFEVITLNQQSDINQSNDFTFQIPKTLQIKEILSQMSQFPKLSELLGNENVRTCITFTGKKDYFVKQSKEMANDYPLLEGSDGVSESYSPIKYSKYIRYDLKLRDKLNKEYIELAKSQGKRTPMVIGLGDMSRFKSPKIFIRLSDSKVTAAYTSEVVCADLSLYIVTIPNLSEKNESFNLMYLLGIINSKIVSYYFTEMGFIRNLGTGTPQIRLKDIRNLPIPIATTDQQTQIAELVDKIINLKKLSQDKISQVNTYLEAKFQIKSTKKLQKLYELENAEFLSELTKQKAKIDLKTEAQLLDYFQTEKVDLLELESQITQVDNQIEELVKGLYGLG